MKNNKGITLIALIITIVIMAIIVGVTISSISGDGIFSKSKVAVEGYTEETAKENLEMVLKSIKMNKKRNSSYNNDTYLTEELQKEGFTVQGNIVIVDGYYFKIDRDGLEISENIGKIDGENIIEIKTADDLKKFRDNVNGGNTYEGKTIYLTADINLNNEEWNPIGKVTDKDGDKGNFFKGTFDGNGYYITGLKINNTEGYSVGLFGLVDGGTIKNLGIKNSTILGCGKVGAIAGSIKNGTIENCYTDGSVKVEATMWASVWGGGLGGILGDGSATIKNCHNGATVYRAEVAKTRNEDNNELNYSWNIGGIVGAVSGTIENSYNTGDVGKGEAGLRECYVGGIAGSFNPTSSDKGIEYCYNLGQVGGNHDVGGIVGIVSDIKKDTAIYTPKINHCYDVGKVTIIADAWYDCKQVGAIVGNYQKYENVNSESAKTTDICTDNIVTECYSLSNVACRPEDAGPENANKRNGCDGTTKDEAYMKNTNFIKDIGGTAYWKKLNGQEYPALKWQKEPAIKSK